MRSVEPFREGDERIFTLQDIVSFFHRKKPLLLQVAILTWVAVFGFLLIFKPPQYKAVATFKEGVEKSGRETSLRDLFAGGASEPQAVVLMQSAQVLRPLAEKLGLQASVPRDGALGKLRRRLRDNFLAQRGKKLPDIDWFRFQDVHYNGEESLSFVLAFTDARHFQLIDTENQVVAKGVLGRKIVLPNLEITIEKAPSFLKLHKKYSLQISPWHPVVQGLKQQISIKSHKMNRSIYDLTILQRDRTLSARLLNELMLQYQHYLKRDHDQISKEQMSYLNQRQGELYQKIDEVLKEHGQYLSENLKNNGLFLLDQEIQSLTRPHEELLGKMFAIDVELARLAKFEREHAWSAPADGSEFSTVLAQKSQAIQRLKQERDLLEISLQRRHAEEAIGAHFDERLEELAQIRSQKEDSKRFLDLLRSTQKIDLPFDLEASIGSWGRDLLRASLGQKEEGSGYLENRIRLLSLREKMLEESPFYGEVGISQLEGIDLATANGLFVQYNARLDGCEANLRYYSELQEEVEKDHFEIGSLSSTLHDPLSHSLIAKASEISTHLKDEQHHSAKEGERWKEDLKLQKKILRDHLEQLYKVEALNANLMREKMGELQRIKLDCINQEISVLNERAFDAIRERGKELLSEKAFLAKKMEDLRSSLTHLPEKWRLETWLDLKTEMSKKMMQAMTELVESKTIGHHLHHVESKPLDFAVIPAGVESPRLFSLASLGAFGASFALFFVLLLGAIFRGFPSSFEKLSAMHFPLLGKVSGVCDGPDVGEIHGRDLDLLRNIALFLKGNVTVLLGGKGPDYSYALGENLAKRGLQTLFIRCDFKASYREEDLPGLLQVCNGEVAELPFRKTKGFDLLLPGGYTPYGIEMIQSKKFQEILASLKERYDHIFLFFKGPLDSAESKAALLLGDQVVVTVSGEKTEELTPFIDWAYHGDNCRLNFIVTDLS